ncbi:unnamed protein product [Ambrosiozyma monospora]|uniref:Unnamed protein product n=1 Tax=Ambrosiozyma monospora TaxID=43982 RepID=A0ACB5T4I8_AMBMO|nr:unnamed protein product [Ambrosiozyma monospora]
MNLLVDFLLDCVGGESSLFYTSGLYDHFLSKTSSPYTQTLVCYSFVLRLHQNSIKIVSIGLDVPEERYREPATFNLDGFEIETITYFWRENSMNEDNLRTICDTFNNGCTSNLNIEELNNPSNQTVDFLVEAKDNMCLYYQGIISQNSLVFAPHAKLKKLGISILGNNCPDPLLDLYQLISLKSFLFSESEYQFSVKNLPKSLERLELKSTKTNGRSFSLPSNLKALLVDATTPGQSFPLITNWEEMKTLTKVAVKNFCYADCTDLFTNLPDSVDDFEFEIFENKMLPFWTFKCPQFLSV